MLPSWGIDLKRKLCNRASFDCCARRSKDLAGVRVRASALPVPPTGAPSQQKARPSARHCSETGEYQETIMDLEAAQTAERAKLHDADLQALHYGQHVRFWERG